MSEFQPLIDQLYRERVLRARERTLGEKMGEVLELSELYFSQDSPELQRRLRIVRALEEQGCYGPPQPRL